MNIYAIIIIPLGKRIALTLYERVDACLYE